MQIKFIYHKQIQQSRLKQNIQKTKFIVYFLWLEDTQRVFIFLVKVERENYTNLSHSHTQTLLIYTSLLQRLLWILITIKPLKL